MSRLRRERPAVRSATAARAAAESVKPAIATHDEPRIALAEELGLSLSPPPVDLPLLTTSLLWHASYDSDPAHIWLRETIVRVAAEEREKTASRSRKQS